MFEPLTKLFGEKAVIVENRLAGIEHQLSKLTEYTASAVAADEYAWLSGTSEADAEKTAEVIIDNTEKVGWMVQRTTVTGGAPEGEGSCTVYLGNILPTNLVDALKCPIGVSQAEYYVAPQSSLIFHFFEQKAPGDLCTVNLQVKRMLVRPEIISVTGREWEATDGDQRIPAGHPLRGPQGQPLTDVSVHNPSSVEIPSQ